MARRKTKKRGRKKAISQRGAPKALASHLLDIVDELHSIDALLLTVPDLEAAARLGSGGDDSPDELSRWAREAFGVDLDAETDADRGPSAPDLADLPNAANTAIEAARWRVRRVARLIAHGSRERSSGHPSGGEASL